MIDINLLREDPTPVIDSIKRRDQEDKLSLIDEVLAKDDEWKQAKGDLDDLRRQRNEISQSINKAKKAGEDASEFIKQAKELPDKIKQQEELVDRLQSRITTILKTLPNILHKDVPSGTSEDENVERKTFGTQPEFNFEPKNHIDIIEELGLVDFEASRRTSGSGFFFLKGSLALLDQALQQYAIDVMLKHGFEITVPPYMLKKEILEGLVDVEEFEQSIYAVADSDLNMISTSEHSLVGMLTATDTDVRDAPITLCGISPCFRAEVGAHGIDEKGLFRTHQFHKVEQVVVCDPKDSQEWFDKLLAITTEIFTSLQLPIRHLEMCTGDLGDMKHRQFDIEVWSPRRNGYFEVGSCSNLTDAQARRLNIRLVEPDGKRVVAHTLNNTAIATSRAMVAIIENFQNEDGSVDIPEVLHPYMRGVTKLE